MTLAIRDRSLLSAKDGEPLSFVAAVKVVAKTEAYLRALDRQEPSEAHLREMRLACADYRECIRAKARYTT